MMKVYATPKLKANRLAPAIIGGIIETVEEKTDTAMTDKILTIFNTI